MHNFFQDLHVTISAIFELPFLNGSRRRPTVDYSMFHVTWTIFKSNRNQLGTVSAFVMISVPWSNQLADQVISEKILSKEFLCRTTDHK